VDRAQLERDLVDTFEGSEAASRVVARQAQDLADAGKIEAELGFELTADAVVSNLADAPDEYDLIERWNWWLDSLELSHGGYNRFRVRPDSIRD